MREREFFAIDRLLDRGANAAGLTRADRGAEALPIERSFATGDGEADACRCSNCATVSVVAPPIPHRRNPDALAPPASLRGPVQDESAFCDPLDAQAMREIEGRRHHNSGGGDVA